MTKKMGSTSGSTLREALPAPQSGAQAINLARSYTDADRQRRDVVGMNAWIERELPSVDNIKRELQSCSVAELEQLAAALRLRLEPVNQEIAKRRPKPGHPHVPGAYDIALIYFALIELGEPIEAKKLLKKRGVSLKTLHRYRTDPKRGHK